MPEIKREPHRMDCIGVDLVHAIDRMPPGAYPFLMNARVLEEGRLEARPGYTVYGTVQGPQLVHSYRRLNDVNANGYLDLIGNGTELWSGFVGAIDTGYSGFPLSLITFRPENSPAAWMYVYDANKQVKVRSDNTVRTIGLAPPTDAPRVKYGPPAWTNINELVTGEGWVATGNATAPALTDRTGGTAPTVGSILYDSGTTEWCCVHPSGTNFSWAGERMSVFIGTEQVIIREIHQAITATTIQAIQYVTGTTGSCSMVLTGSPTGLKRNSLIQIDSELVRVLAVIPSPDGSTYSVRCSTTINHVAAAPVLGLYSWYLYTVANHVAAEAIVTNYEASSSSAAIGTVNTAGVTVTWVSGSKFDLLWPVGTVPGQVGATKIKIANDIWTIANVASPTILTVLPVGVGGHDPGIQAGAAFSVNLPSLDSSVQLLLKVSGGTVTTATNMVNWVSGPKFADWPTGTKIVINAVTYTIAYVASNILLALTTLVGVHVGVAYSVPGINAQTANGRPLSISDDYIHFSVFLQWPKFTANVIFAVDIDPATTTVGATGNAFTGNYWTWVVPNSALIPDDPGTAIYQAWIEIVVPIASGVRVGNNSALDFSNITALKVQVLTTNTTNFGFGSWQFFGTYGPNVVRNSPVGLLYEIVNRDSQTGVASIPGPITDHDMFPLREEVLVTPPQSAIAGVDSLDVYRQGAVLLNFTYVGTVPNDTSILSDVQSDVVLASNPSPDLSLIQPWPILGVSWKGVVNVVGTLVTWVSGTVFDLNLLANTVIQINGTAYFTRGQPLDSTHLRIATSGGVQTGVSFQVGAPTLAAQPLPYVFGALEGPFAPVLFGLGDRVNAGTLYFTNPSNADTASDRNTIELNAPSEPLISGDVWNGLAFAGSHDNVYVVRYSYLTTIGVEVGGPVTYQWSRLPGAAGIWCRWACQRGPDGVYYLGKDGLYKMTDQGSVNVTDELLYPLFPHDGQAAKYTNGLYPVDMTQTTKLRLIRGDECMLFYYVDTAGQSMCMRYEYLKKRWFPLMYADQIGSAYTIEESENTPSTSQLLLLARTTGKVYLAGGNSDNGSDLTTTVQLPTFDGGDERMQKLYVDAIHDLDQVGSVSITLGFNDNTSLFPVAVTATGFVRDQYIQNVAELTNLALWRNITARYQWSGGPDGPRLYAFEHAAYAQPYVSNRIMTQVINLAYPGWKHHRRLYAGLISNSATTFTIKCQDGRTFQIVIPTTDGQFRIFPIMLPQAIKDLAFGYQLDGAKFALFPDAFTIETKETTQPEYVQLPIFKT